MPGGPELSKNTRVAARSPAFSYPSLTDRHAYQAWSGIGKLTIYTKATKKVDEIFSAPLEDPLPGYIFLASFRWLKTGWVLGTNGWISEQV